MRFAATKLPDAYIIDVDKREDERGFFARVWCRREFHDHGIEIDALQGNLSVNRRRGTLRGLHYQAAPHQEGKLVRCTHGAIYDVIVDIRPESPAFRQWIGVELTAASCRMLYAPKGFAHGYQTLTDDAEVSYLVSQYYQPDAGRGLRYDDPALRISWPLPVTQISAQDRSWPLLAPVEAAD